MEFSPEDVSVAECDPFKPSLNGVHEAAPSLKLNDAPPYFLFTASLRCKAAAATMCFGGVKVCRGTPVHKVNIYHIYLTGYSCI